MTVTKLYQSVRSQQEEWRRRHISVTERGWHNDAQYNHVLPRRSWELNLFPGIRSGAAASLPDYLKRHGVQTHTGVHNLCSSWVLCANLYFPFRTATGYTLLAGFLNEVVSAAITDVEEIQLEYEVPDPRFTPASLLGEGDGRRGSGQTSPDVAFLVRTKQGKGLVLTESKFTERWFYQCSGNRTKTSGRAENPDRSRCQSFQRISREPEAGCHLVQWERRYWEHLRPRADAPDLPCPAATGAYQLFRQQALADALAASGEWDLVVSAVAYDARNQNLFKVIGAGRTKRDVRPAWGTFFETRAPLVSFTHQSWVDWVRRRAPTECAEWLHYVTERYGY